MSPRESATNTSPPMSTTATARASPAIPEPVLTTSTSSSHFTVNYLGIAKSSGADTGTADLAAQRTTDGGSLGGQARQIARVIPTANMKLPQPAQGLEGVCRRGLWQRHENTTGNCPAKGEPGVTQPR